MTRKAFLFGIRPGMEEEYDRRHREVWPELIQLQKEIGFRNYSIYRYRCTLFAYMEFEGDFETQFRKFHSHPSQAKWREYMSDIIIRDENMGFQFMDEVYHLD